MVFNYEIIEELYGDVLKLDFQTRKLSLQPN